MREIKTILVTTDFSETAARALPWAQQLATRFGARLLLAHIHDEWMPFVAEYGQFNYQELIDQGRRTADQKLAAAAAELGPQVEPVSGVGTPHHEIVRLAEEREVDLIVMATHGRGFVSHALLGSTTERVLRRASCPVLVVRDAGER